MLKNLSTCLVISMLVIISFPVLSAAQSEMSETNQAVTTSSDNPAPDQLTDEEKAQKLQERITAAKEKALSKINANQEKRLAGICKASQTLIEKIQLNTSTFIENRQSKYATVNSKLTELSDKLAAAGADVTELNAAISEMETKYNTNEVIINDYATSLNDLTSIDCASDPSGFKAILESTRMQRKDILTQTSTIRTYINDTIKPILQGIRNSLQPATEGEGTN
jgi:chromosome segregation ATPase